MKYCHYYWLLEPINDEYRDTASRAPTLTTTITYGDKTYDFGVFCDENNVPEFARLTIQGLESDDLP